MSPPITRPTMIVWSPPGIRGEALALDVRQGAVEQDLALGPDVIADAVEPVLVLVGEPARELLLAALEDVHHELRRRDDEVVHVGRVLDADREQRRLQRHRREAARGHAGGLPAGSRDRQDGDAGREAAEQLAEAGGIDARRGSEEHPREEAAG